MSIDYFDTNTATDAELFGDVGDFGVGVGLNAQLAHSHDRTRFFALLATLFWLASIRADYSDSRQGLLFFIIFFRVKFAHFYISLMIDKLLIN